MTTKSEVAKALAVMADTYGKKLSPEAADMFLDDLDGFSPIAILAALRLCRRELGRFPTVADIITRIQTRDGRPGVEEAWSMIPKDDRGSVVWCEEMAVAFGAASPLLRGGDPIGARMAFKEVYEREVRKARDANIPAKWTESFGDDVSSREGAVREAIARNRVTEVAGRAMLPSLEWSGAPASKDVARLAQDVAKKLEGPA